MYSRRASMPASIVLLQFMFVFSLLTVWMALLHWARWPDSGRHRCAHLYHVLSDPFSAVA
jgi:hypothetical protein